jgi:hypothetical protein
VPARLSRVRPAFDEFATVEPACQEHTGWWNDFLAAAAMLTDGKRTASFRCSTAEIAKNSVGICAFGSNAPARIIDGSETDRMSGD